MKLTKKEFLELDDETKWACFNAINENKRRLVRNLRHLSERINTELEMQE